MQHPPLKFQQLKLNITTQLKVIRRKAKELRLRGEYVPELDLGFLIAPYTCEEIIKGQGEHPYSPAGNFSILDFS